MAELQQAGLVLIGDPPGPDQMCKSELACLFLEVGFLRTCASDHYWPASAGHRLEQILQPLVVTQYADKQEKARRQASAPIGQALGRRLGVGLAIQAIGYDYRLAAKPTQDLAAFKIVRRGSDDAVHARQEALHQRLIKGEQCALADDVRMIADDAWPLVPAHEVH